MATIEIVQSVLAQVTDLGRPGYGRSGIPVNGAADQMSAKVANALVGNPVGHRLIEVVATDFAFRAEDPVLVAVTGAAARIEVDGHRRQHGQPLHVEEGSCVRISDIHSGVRCYVAIRGRLQVPELLGSCAPDPMLGTATGLAVGARILVDTTYRSFSHTYLPQPLFRFDVLESSVGWEVAIDVVQGPQADQFPDGVRLLESSRYLVGPESNHVGLRLQGAVPKRTRAEELLSRGVPVGAIEIPPSEELIVLLRGRMVTAGYPVIAVATRTSRDTLGQLRPGNAITFRYVTAEEAIRSYQERNLLLERLRTRVNAAFAAAGVASEARAHL